MVFRKIFILLSHLCFVRVIDGGITSQWDFCGCRWDDWQAWGMCSKECNGVRVRERMVWLYDNKDGCLFKFQTCATSDMAYDYSRCNEFCYNGGTSDSYSCSCVTGFYGSCCGFQVNCGDPGTIPNGKVNGDSFTYGSVITYSCNSGYLLVSSSTSRICQLDHTWSGTTPRCAYYASCSSSPCKNGATCNNIPDDYSCSCTVGWSGKDCSIDIQPPQMQRCPVDMDLQTADLTKEVEWQIPHFFDPHNFEIEVTSNYPTNHWKFPWGDFTISYSALKPNNGLTNECHFQVKIRPHPCPPRNAPLNGAFICTNWKTDYGQFCVQMCQEAYTVPRGADPDRWFVCGASGTWIPPTTSNCSVLLDNLMSADGYKIGSSFKSCTEENFQIKTAFINKLKTSSFNYFCQKFSDECTTHNVLLKCH